MSSTFTTTFTRTDAHYIATKIAADLRQMKNFYGQPLESWIEAYLEEITEHLACGYLESFEAGFKIVSTNRRVVTLKYSVRDGNVLADDGSGRVYPGADIQGASFFNYLSRSSKFFSLSADEQAKFKARMPIQRTPEDAPVDGSGYWTADKSYSSAGTGTSRSTFRPN